MTTPARGGPVADADALAEYEGAVLKSIIPKSEAPGCDTPSFWSGAAAALIAAREPHAAALADARLRGGLNATDAHEQAVEDARREGAVTERVRWTGAIADAVVKIDAARPDRSSAAGRYVAEILPAMRDALTGLRDRLAADD